MLKYAGIGPRSTPTAIQETMTCIARQLSDHWTLRSGHANGADRAFEQGAFGGQEIFLPWDGYNGAYSNGITRAHRPICPDQLYLAEGAYNQYRKDYAPNNVEWSRMKDTTKMLFARNVCIIMGEDLASNVDCVITWHGPNYVGGTIHAVVLAMGYNIPIFNIFHELDQEKLVEFTNRLENITA